MEKTITFEAHDGQVLDLLFTPDSRSLVSAGMDNVVRVWSATDWQRTTTLQAHHKSVNALALAPGKDPTGDALLATGSSDATLKLWRLSSGELLHTLRDRKKTVSTVAFSDDGAYVAGGWYGGRAVVWTSAGKEVVSIKASDRNLSSVAFSPVGERLATAGLGDAIGVWDIPSGTRAATLSGHETAVGSLHFVGQGSQLISLGYEGTIHLWNTETWEPERVVALHGARPRRLVLSGDEKRAALSLEGRVQLWDAATWEPTGELPVGTKAVGGMAFSPDGAWLAVGAADGKIRVWEMG